MCLLLTFTRDPSHLVAAVYSYLIADWPNPFQERNMKKGVSRTTKPGTEDEDPNQVQMVKSMAILMREQADMLERLQRERDEREERLQKEREEREERMFREQLEKQERWNEMQREAEEKRRQHELDLLRSLRRRKTERIRRGRWQTNWSSGRTMTSHRTTSFALKTP